MEPWVLPKSAFVLVRLRRSGFLNTKFRNDTFGFLVDGAEEAVVTAIVRFLDPDPARRAGALSWAAR